MIHLGALRQNVSSIRQALPNKTKLMAVVKADAYGHGMLQVAQAAVEAGAETLGVATVAEGVQLREAGISTMILVLGAAVSWELDDAVAHHLTLAITDTERVLALQQACDRQHTTADVHLKVDTGMNRIGIKTPDEVLQMVACLQTCSSVRLSGAFSHFADADGEDQTYTAQQLNTFVELCKLLPQGICKHIANSAAIHMLPGAAFDMVRAGISMYGYPPVATSIILRPVMSWFTYVSYVKEVQAGDYVSYGCTYKATSKMRVATIQCGYGDGYHRMSAQKAYVLIHGKRAKVIGRICMDQMMVDVTDIPQVRIGDRVVLMGRDGDETITAEDLASWASTITYEVLLAATGRVNRIWMNDR